VCSSDLITALSGIRWLFVIARNSTFTYKGRPVDVKEVGRELGIRYVLEGSVRKAGRQVRITGQLIDALTGTHLWAGRYDGSLEECSTSRTRSLSASPESLSRRCKRPRCAAPPRGRRPISPPTISTCVGPDFRPKKK
jgi:TolB-like protein